MFFFLFQAEDGIRDLVRSRGLGDVYKRQLLIWYWDGSQTDNNVSSHQGHGLILPIDARPKLMKFDKNGYWSPVVQAYDATFSKQRTDAITLYNDGQALRYPRRRAIRCSTTTRSIGTRTCLVSAASSIRPPIPRSTC